MVITESGGAADKQIANIEDMIAQKVDAIILTPNSPSALAPVCEKAIKAGNRGAVPLLPRRSVPTSTRRSSR